MFNFLRFVLKQFLTFYVKIVNLFKFSYLYQLLFGLDIRLSKLFHTLLFSIKYAPWIKKIGKNTFALTGVKIRPTLNCSFEVSINDNSTIYPETEFRGRGVITIGNNSSIGHRNIFSCTSSVQIGNYVLTADDVKFYTANHKYNIPDLYIANQGEDQGKIIIENDVWIGANVVLLKNAHIKNGSIIGSNSVVTGIVPPNEIWGGVPAKKIKDRY